MGRARRGERERASPIEVLAAGIDRRVSGEEILDRFRSVRPHLTNRQWQVVVLRYENGLKNVDIAAALRVHPSVVSRLLARAVRTVEDEEASRRREKLWLGREQWKESSHSEAL